MNIPIDLTDYRENILAKKEIKLLAMVKDIWKHTDGKGRLKISVFAGFQDEKQVDKLLKANTITVGIAYGFMQYLGLQAETFFKGYPETLANFKEIFTPIIKDIEAPKYTKEQVLAKYFK